MKKIRLYILLAISGVLVSSCVDTIVLPVDKTIGDNYWKSYDQVQMMVAGAYNGLTSADAVNRMIVWGELRGDNVNHNADLPSSATLSTFAQVNTMNMDDKNTYSNWAVFYSVINKCNQVLKQAPAVREIDPQYSKGVCRSDSSQMLALRALSYFYLVRAFRDVPYSDQPFLVGSDNFELPQLPADEVLTKCIDDLEVAIDMSLASTAYNDWRRTGLFNKDGVRALLADIYLWRASMNTSNAAMATRNASDYQRCADLCADVIRDRGNWVVNSKTNEQLKYYYSAENGLLRGDRVYAEVFANGNSDESLFELQFDGSNAVNTAVCQDYWQYKAKTTPGFMKATQAFGVYNADKNANTIENVFASRNDYRFWAACLNVNNATAESFVIRKMISTDTEDSKLASQSSVGRDLQNYNKFGQNWIVYRLSDVFLMQAEALVQLAAEGATIDTDENLKKAFDLVSLIYSRSLAVEADALDAANFNSKTLMEELVLSERRRELCFEGKRWFDLVRYAYRHMTGVDATHIMADQHLDSTDEEGKAVADVAKFPDIYANMRNIVKAKYLEGGAGVAYQLSTEPKLYFPVLESELKVNGFLKQNPGYKSSKGYSKNY